MNGLIPTDIQAAPSGHSEFYFKERRGKSRRHEGGRDVCRAMLENWIRGTRSAYGQYSSMQFLNKKQNLFTKLKTRTKNWSFVWMNASKTHLNFIRQVCFSLPISYMK